MKKIQIRLQEIGDAKRFFKILKNPGFKYFSANPKTIKDEIEFLKLNPKKMMEDSEYNFTILFEDEIVGAIGVKKCCRHDGTGEIGYFLDEKYWNKGIVTEAVKLLEKKCFNDYNLRRLEILMQVKNTASEKVAIKCGYTREGLLKKFLKNRSGKYTDFYLYTKIK